MLAVESRQVSFIYLAPLKQVLISLSQQVISASFCRKWSWLHVGKVPLTENSCGEDMEADVNCINYFKSLN